MRRRVHRLGDWTVEINEIDGEVLLVGTVVVHPLPADLQQLANELADMLSAANSTGRLPSLHCDWHRSSVFGDHWNLRWAGDRLGLPKALAYALLGDVQALALGADWDELSEPFEQRGGDHRPDPPSLHDPLASA